MIDAREIAQHLEHLPTLPASVVRLQRVVQDEQSSAQDIEAVIKPDPALTANLLRLANSSFFGLPRKVDSVRQAIALLGLKRVFETAISAAFSDVIPSIIPGYGLRAVQFWQHSVAVAIFSEQLARELELETPAMTFTAGLLHDLGKLAIGTYLARVCDEAVQTVREGQITLFAAEQQLLGTDHSETGHMLAEKWQLPEEIVMVASCHHTCSQQIAEDKRRIVELVHVADCLAHSLGFGADLGELARRIDQASVVKLGIKPRRIERVVCRAVDQIDEMTEMMFNPTEHPPHGERQ
jgi:putative nucleotidyltransferase with HDIG domain